MLFNSNAFIFGFLPIVLVVYQLLCLQQKTQWALPFLLAASWFFYAWWNPNYFPLLLISIVVNFWVAQHLSGGSRAKIWLTSGIAFNLGLLGYFKYVHFVFNNAASLFGQDWQIEANTLPLAISFFTFQQLAYLVDHYHRPTPSYSFRQYGAFVSFFPQLIAGPIVKHDTLLPQLTQRIGKPLLHRDLSIGLMIFTLGLAKKVLIADHFAPYANAVFDAADAGESLTLLEAWGGVSAYTLQLYFDFSGYSDMAIGLARMFSIRLPINFNSPYQASSIIEFWRRWHITLSSFLRQYLYIPLGGNRRGGFYWARNLMLTMLLGGLWHGAGWNFILWGGLHGLYLMLNHAWRHSRLSRIVMIPKAIYVALTLTCVAWAWVPFRTQTSDGCWQIWQAMLGTNGLRLPKAMEAAFQPWALDSLSFGSMAYFHGGVQVITTALAIALVLLAPNVNQLCRSTHWSCRFPKLKQSLSIAGHPRHLSAYGIGALLFVTTLAINSLERMDFLYFNF